MPVVRIDEKLLLEIKTLLKDDENKYKYPSVSSFINSAVFEKLKEENNGKKRGK